MALCQIQEIPRYARDDVRIVTSDFAIEGDIIMVVKHHRSEDTLTLTLTDAAKAHFSKKVFSQTGKIGVRFSVKKTGCSGLSYVVEYVDFVEDDDIILRLVEGLQVCVDRQSAPFINGSIVDYVRDGLNAKLVFNNPNQKGQCGCGESFIV